ncbi:hypothetical protein ABT120_30245 [Nonomuraea angiospora]
MNSKITLRAAARVGQDWALPHLVALVRAGARIERGVLVEREPVTAA